MSIKPITQVTPHQLNEFCKGKNIELQTIPEYFKDIVDLSKFDFSKPLKFTDIVNIFDYIAKATGEIDWLSNIKNNLVELNGINYLLFVSYSTSNNNNDRFNELSINGKLKLLNEPILKVLNQEQINKAANEIQKLIDEAEEFANKTKTQLKLNVAYGVGRTYYGSTQEWEPSSQSC